MNKNAQFEHKIKNSLNANVDALDMETRQRLAHSRKQALNSQTQRFAWLSSTHYLPASALALCTLFAVFLVFSPQTHEANPVQIDYVVMFELLNNSDEIDAMTDPDFYAWIDESLNDNLNETDDIAS